MDSCKTGNDEGELPDDTRESVSTSTSDKEGRVLTDQPLPSPIPFVPATSEFWLSFRMNDESASRRNEQTKPNFCERLERSSDGSKRAVRDETTI
jgi:hypothetical protein